MVKACCCGCSLSNGSIAIGAVFLSLSILGAVFAGWGISAWTLTYDAIREAQALCKDPVQTQYNRHCQHLSQGDLDPLSNLYAWLQPKITAFLVVYMGICLFQIVVNSLLIHGCKKKRPGLLVPFIVAQLVSFGFSVFIVIININFFGFLNSLYGLIVSILLWVLNGYLTVVVISCRAEMVAELRGNDEEEMKNGIGKDVGIYNPGYLKGF